MTDSDVDKNLDDVEELLARLSNDLTIDDLGSSDNIDLSEIGADLKRFQEHELVKAALSQGVDLRQYAREIEVSLRDVERNSIQDYVREADNLGQLHDKIQSCDSILEKMETMLSSFQTDLGAISSQIKTLQDESLSMNIKLKNRKALNTKLSHFVTELSVSPELVNGISDAEVNAIYVEYITTLNSRLQFSGTELASNALAKSDIDPVLENLKNKAIVRLRDFLLGKIALLKRPKTNIQVMQQTVFLKHKYFYVFLREHAPLVAREIQSTYVESLSKVYFSLLKTYTVALLKLLEDIANKDDVIGSSEDVSKGFFSQKHSTRNRHHSAFLLADRGAVLGNISHPPIVPHAALQAKVKFPLEQIVRSIVYLLMDSAAFEYQFLLEFFAEREVFSLVFGKALNFVAETICGCVVSSFDCIGLMLIAQVLREMQVMMVSKRLNCLDSFFDKVGAAVWSRFRKVLDMNLISVRNFSQKEEARLKDTNPHYITRRFADFSSSLMLLHQLERQRAEGETSVEADSVVTSMFALRTEMEILLDTLVTRSWPHDKRQMSIFLINNLDLIQAVYKERGIQHTEYMSELEEVKSKHLASFVEDQLMSNFGPLVTFVKTYQSKITGASFEENRKQIDEAKLISVVQEFKHSWAGGIDRINTNVMKFFPNFKNGVEILKQVLAQLVTHYSRFTEIIKRCYRAPPFARDMVDVDVIMEEIKKYSRSF